MIMEDFENESNKNSSWSMSEISEPSSETSSSSSTNQEPECSLTDSNILDEINKKTKTDVSKPSRRTTLVKLCWHLLCDVMLIIFIISTVLGVVTNSSQPKIRASNRPKPFLIGGNVKDYYRGNVFQTFKDASLFENSLLMFYSPWDRESQEARSVLQEVGSFFAESDILVAGVNCWYPTSDCAKEFGSKTSGTRYPVFIFYPSYLKGIQYRGSVRADHLISWILRCRHPLTRLDSLDHFHKLHTDHTNVLVGYLPGLGANVLDPNYVPMLQCAHYLLESDPDTRVTVTSDPDLARTLHLHINHPVRLFSWNTSYSYPNKTVDSAKCNTWTIRHVSRVSQWISLPGRKSLILKSYLGDHSLLVFTPRNKLAVNQVEIFVTEVAARYSNCNNTNSTADLVTRLRHKLSQHPPSPTSRCHKASMRQYCQLKSFTSTSDTLPACQRLISGNTSSSNCDLISDGIKNSVDHDINLMIQEHRTEVSNIQKHNDNVSWKDVKFADYDAIADSISGLSCEHNRTLNIILVDTSKHGYSLIADSLGINVNDDDSSTTVAIVSLKEETVSVQHVSSSHNLTEVLEKMLLRWHHSGDVGGHYGLRSSDRTSRVQVGEDSVGGCEDGVRSCIREVTRDQLMMEDSLVNREVTRDQLMMEDSLVNSSSVSTVLLYTSSYCSQCTTTNYVFHSVAELLDQAGIKDVQFRMMESTRNDPPVQLTALAYPSVIFFPRGRPEQSRVFPSYKELNISSLLTFVLSNLSPQQRLVLALSSCDAKCLAKLRLTAASKLSSLENTRRRMAMTSLNSTLVNSWSRHIKHVRTVLYVLSAIEENNENVPELPQSQSQRYYTAILENFINKPDSP